MILLPGNREWWNSVFWSSCVVDIESGVSLKFETKASRKLSDRSSSCVIGSFLSVLLHVLVLASSCFIVINRGGRMFGCEELASGAGAILCISFVILIERSSQLVECLLRTCELKLETDANTLLQPLSGHVKSPVLLWRFKWTFNPEKRGINSPLAIWILRFYQISLLPFNKNLRIDKWYEFQIFDLPC